MRIGRKNDVSRDVGRFNYKRLLFVCVFRRSRTEGANCDNIYICFRAENTVFFNAKKVIDTKTQLKHCRSGADYLSVGLVSYQ